MATTGDTERAAWRDVGFLWRWQSSSLATSGQLFATTMPFTDITEKSATMLPRAGTRRRSAVSHRSYITRPARRQNARRQTDQKNL
jgi:hypothetical protein